MQEPAEDASPLLTSHLVWLLAIGCGVTVANLWYNQPLLAQMAVTLRTTEQQMGTVAACGMCGYATGLVLFVPLGDIINRRTLILVFQAAIVTALVSVACAPGLSSLAILTFLLGAATIVPQLIIPLAAGLAGSARRGAIVGKMMSGLLIGILVSRTIGGSIGEHYGWRSVYWFGAVINTLLLVAFGAMLPSTRPTSKMRYVDLLKSTVQLALGERVVQTSGFFGAMTFGCFSAFWTTLSFFASGAPYFFKAESIGMFGLVGAVGALAAPLSGKLADRRGPMFGIGLALVIMLISFAILNGWGANLWGLILGVVVLDLAAQTSQVSNMARVYSLPKELHNRLNTIYMTSYFVGGSLGAWVGTLCWSNWGWSGVCLFGALLCTLGIAMYAVTATKERSVRA